MIFDEQIARKPDNYPWSKEFIEAAHAGFWTDKEFSFSSDIQDFKVHLTEEEREIIVRTLSAIGQIEIAVKTFWAKLGENLPHPSLADLGYCLAHIEVIHNNAYERLLDVLGLEDQFEKNLKLDWISGRVKYLKKYTHKYYKDSKKQYVYALILFTLFVENVSLFSQFYIVNWFGRKRLLKDTNQQVAYTAREEQLHALVGMKLVNVIREEHPELFDEELTQKILQEATEAFKAESKIIDWMVNGINDERLNAPLLKEFVKNRINESLVHIGFTKIFEVDKEMIAKTRWFDEEILGNSHVDFFHSRSTNYSKKSHSFDENSLF